MSDADANADADADADAEGIRTKSNLPPRHSPSIVGGIIKPSLLYT